MRDRGEVFVACFCFDTCVDSGFSSRYSTGNPGIGQGKCVPSSEGEWIILVNKSFNIFYPINKNVHCWRDPSDVEGVAIQCLSARRKKIIIVVFVGVGLGLEIFFVGLGPFFLARHFYRVRFALAHRHHLFFGDGAAALRFGCAFCRCFDRHGKIIVVGVAARRRPRYVVVVDVRIFMSFFDLSSLLE
jgi:hypothetical protein